MSPLVVVAIAVLAYRMGAQSVAAPQGQSLTSILSDLTSQGHLTPAEAQAIKDAVQKGQGTLDQFLQVLGIL